MIIVLVIVVCRQYQSIDGLLQNNKTDIPNKGIIKRNPSLKQSGRTVV